MTLNELPNDVKLERHIIQKFTDEQNIRKLKSWLNVTNEDDFYNEECRKAFCGIQACINKGRVSDVGSIIATGFITKEEIKPIISTKATSTDMKQLTLVLKEYSLKREVLIETDEIRGKIASSSNPREDALAYADRISNISKSKSSGDLLKTKDTIRKTLQMFKDGASADSKLRVFFNAKFMDDYVMAFRKEVVVVGGNSGLGKTSLGLTCVLQQVLAGQNIVYFCNESDETKLMAKIMSQYVGCSFTDLMLHMDKLSSEEVQRLKEITYLLEQHADNFHLYGAGTYPHSVSGIAIKAQEIAEEFGQIDMLYVDYLQDMIAPTGYKVESAESVAYNIQGIKNIIQTLNCACVVMCQINRDTKNNENKKPVLENLKGSSKIENIASVVLFLHRVVKEDDRSKEILPTLMYTPKTRDQKNINTLIGFRGKCTKYEKYIKPLEHQYGIEDRPPPNRR